MREIWSGYLVQAAMGCVLLGFGAKLAALFVGDVLHHTRFSSLARAFEIVCRERDAARREIDALERGAVLYRQALSERLNALRNCSCGGADGGWPSVSRRD